MTPKEPSPLRDPSTSHLNERVRLTISLQDSYRPNERNLIGRSGRFFFVIMVPK